MKETPILMCGDMVAATLAGLKFETRRVVKFPAYSVNTNCCDPEWLKTLKTVKFYGKQEFGEDCCEGWCFSDGDGRSIKLACPYGNSRDKLWVKETFFDVRKYKSYPLFAGTTVDFIYRADYEYREVQGRRVIGDHHWKPSIFMSHTASRIALEIVETRVERVQDITEAAAIAEGISELWPEGYHWRKSAVSAGATAVEAYRSLWNSINLKPKPLYETDEKNGKKVIVGYVSYPWSMKDFDDAYPEVIVNGRQYRGLPITVTANPWVWVVKFKKLSRGYAEARRELNRKKRKELKPV